MPEKEAMKRYEPYDPYWMEEPFGPADKVLNFRRLIDTQLQHEDGDLILPQTPGLGFMFDERAVKKYALEAWRIVK